MRIMNQSEAKQAAIEAFLTLPLIKMEWNLVHCRCMIRAIEDLAVVSGKNIDIERLSALAWAHDIGKTMGDESHAKSSLAILEKNFKLDKTDRDCILNHGSKDHPETEEGRIFHEADGLSLFYPEAVAYRFYAEAKEGAGYEDIKKKMANLYQKYTEAYSDSPAALKIMRERYLMAFCD